MTDDATERTENALQEVRTECRKAAVLYALVDATAVFLAGNVLVVAVGPGWLPGDVTLPATVGDPVADVLGLQTPVGLPGSAILALVVGLVTFVGETLFRLQRPLIEQFEAANPAVAESLRTARDAVDDGADSPMAVRLYEDVLDRLGESSGLALVDEKRVLAPVVLIVVLAVVTPGAAVVDAGRFGGTAPAVNATEADDNRTYRGLRDGSRVLGDSESVQAGEDELTAAVESSGAAGSEDDTQRAFPETGDGGSSGTAGGIDGQQAGFDSPERVEEAELVRKYHRRIREEENE